MNKEMIAEALKQIEDKEGRLTPDLVVKKAKNPAHPLHNCFEWDDRKAGHAHRLDQARHLMTVRIRHRVEETVMEVPIYCRDPAAPAGTQGYRNTMRIKNDVDHRRDVLVVEMTRVASALQRSRDLAAFFGAADVIVAMEAQVAAFLSDISNAPPS